MQHAKNGRHVSDEDALLNFHQTVNLFCQPSDSRTIGDMESLRHELQINKAP